MNELEIEGKKYVSSKRAAELTGYAKDYVGQLCREGRVVARQVGRAWYVLESSLMEHRYASEEAARTSNTIASTWEAPRYAAETPQPLPEVQRPEADAGTVAAMQAAWQEWFSLKKAVPPEEEPVEEPVSESFERPDPTEESLAETDQASEAQNEPLEAPEEEARVAYEEESVAQPEEIYEDSAPVEVPIERVRSEPMFSQAHFDMPAVPVHAPAYQYEPAPEPQYAPIYADPVAEEFYAEIAEERGSSWGWKALIGLVAIVVIAIGVLGSGVANPYLQRLGVLGYTSFITGTDEVSK